MTNELNHEARELTLYVENDQQLHNQRKAVGRALAKKKKKDNFDASKARAAFKPLLVMAAKKYLRENGSPGDKWNVIFPTIARAQAARYFVELFEDEYKSGEAE